MKTQWWKQAVIYQVYPRSFQDTNGDGIGDLQGIIAHLDYLADLGINAIWVSPMYRSPQADNGYDVSDYQDIDPIFGTLDDMRQLIAEAKKRDIGIIIDLVINHSSDEHPWFQEALKGKDNPYHEHYIWREGPKDHPPTDAQCAFGGSSWKWIPELGQFYYHQFSEKQPDLNWDNPAMRQDLYKMIQWWIDQGIAGFRLDVCDHYSKNPDLEVFADGVSEHEKLREMSSAVFQGNDIVTVGEAWTANIENAPFYSNPDGSELSMVFQFEHMVLDQTSRDKWDMCPLRFLELKEVLSKWQTKLHGRGWNSLFFENHDLSRIVSRWGNDKQYHKESAKMLATVLLGMEGTPYIYQGQELGMTNTKMAIEQYNDIETLSRYKKRVDLGYPMEEIMQCVYERSRDNARTPMQWDDTPQAGFTTGTPWLPVNPNYKEINAKQQSTDKDSILSYYKAMIQLRKTYPVFIDGSYELMLREDEEIFAYKRIRGDETIYIVCNFYGNERSIALSDLIPEDAKLLLTNYRAVTMIAETNSLHPYEARVYHRREE